MTTHYEARKKRAAKKTAKKPGWDIQTMSLSRDEVIAQEAERRTRENMASEHAARTEAMSILTREMRDLREQVTAVLANHAPAPAPLQQDISTLTQENGALRRENESLSRQLAEMREAHAKARGILHQVADGNGDATDLAHMAQDFLNGG